MSKDSADTDAAPPEAPESHPEPDRWWVAIEWQSWIALIALIGLGMALVFGDVDEAAGTPLTIVAIGLAGTAMALGGGSTCIGFAKAWRGKP